MSWTFARTMLLAASLMPGIAPEAAQANAEKVLFAFATPQAFAEPYSAYPFVGAIDGANNVYGDTEIEGTDGYGTIFKLAPDGTLTTLVAFNASNGADPFAPPILGPARNLYGTSTDGYGTVFKLTPNGTLTTLYAFSGGSDGQMPEFPLVIDRQGALYGTTYYGGGSCDCGVVFTVAADGSEHVLHAFAGGSGDGQWPYGALALDRKGNLYGTTQRGGSGDSGTVFRLAPDGREKLLYAFSGGNDGSIPQAGVIVGSKGDLDGTTFDGGSGGGVVFEVTRTGGEKVLHTFTGGRDGAGPLGGLVMGASGALYGTATGGASCCGVVFKIAPDGTFTTLYAFKGGCDGNYPDGPLLMSKDGDLYGTTYQGGSGCNLNTGCGTVFVVRNRD